MTIAPRLHQLLDQHDAHYEVIEHSPTRSSMQTAETCHVPGRQLAKAVLLEADDDYLLAVLPSDRRIQLSELRSELGREPRLVREESLGQVFDDCVSGAVPPLGDSYGVAMIVDDSLRNEPDIYFEAGDHGSLIHVDQAEFSRLTRRARHGQFSEPWLDG